MQFILDNIVSISGAYISGYSEDTFIWNYNKRDNVETIIPMYDHSTDRCHGYCPWTLDSPNSAIPIKNYLQIATFPGFPGQAFIRSIEDQSLKYICEFDDPIETDLGLLIPNQDANVQLIKIYHNKEFNVHNSDITIVNQETGYPYELFYREKSQTSSSWAIESYNFPDGLPFGQYDVHLSNSENDLNLTLYYETKPPHIDCVHFSEEDSLYFKVDLKGFDMEQSTIYFGNANCELGIMGETCRVAVGSPLVPLKVTINGINRITYKYPIYYSLKFNMMGLVGYMQGVYSQDFANIVKRIISDSTPIKFGISSATEFWMNYEALATTSNCIVTTGPAKDEIRTPYFTGQFPPPLDQHLNSYILSVPSFQLAMKPDTYMAGMIVEMGGYNPLDYQLAKTVQCQFPPLYDMTKGDLHGDIPDKSLQLNFDGVYSNTIDLSCDALNLTLYIHPEIWITLESSFHFRDQHPCPEDCSNNDLSNHSVWNSVESSYSSMAYSSHIQDRTNVSDYKSLGSMDLIKSSNFSSKPDFQRFGTQRLIIDPYSINYEIHFNLLRTDHYNDSFYIYEMLFVTNWTLPTAEPDCPHPEPAFSNQSLDGRLQVSQIQENGVIFTTRYSDSVQEIDTRTSDIDGTGLFRYYPSNVTILNRKDHANYYHQVDPSGSNQQIQLTLVTMYQQLAGFKFIINTGIQSIIEPTDNNTSSSSNSSSRNKEENRNDNYDNYNN
eukprot:gene2891-3321_t